MVFSVGPRMASSSSSSAAIPMLHEIRKVEARLGDACVKAVVLKIAATAENREASIACSPGTVFDFYVNEESFSGQRCVLEQKSSSIGTDENAIVEIEVPPRCDISVHVGKGDVVVQGKLEGETIMLSSMSGDIVLSKVRGSNLQLRAPNGKIAVSSSLEGLNAAIRTSEFVAKRVMAKSMSVRCRTSFSAEAVYVDSLKIDCKRGSVSLGAVQGDATVNAGESIRIEDMDGSVNASAQSGNASVHFSSFGNDSKPSRIHAAECGDVNATVGSDPPWKAHVASNGGQIKVPADSTSISTNREGFVVCKPEPRRNDDSRFGMISGKVRTQKFSYPNGYDEDTNSLSLALRVVASEGNASLEVLSWKEMLMRKFSPGDALDDDSKNK